MDENPFNIGLKWHSVVLLSEFTAQSINLTLTHCGYTKISNSSTDLNREMFKIQFLHETSHFQKCYISVAKLWTK